MAVLELARKNGPQSAAVLVAGLASLLLYALGPQPCDDAYITFRHAQHFSDALRPAWNLDGPAAFGSTTPLYTLLLGALGLLSGSAHIDALAFLLNLALHFVLVLLAYRCGFDMTRSQTHALACALVVGCSSVGLYTAALGFETTLLTVCVFLVLDALARQQYALAVAVAGAALLVRPEGILLGALVWAWLVAGRRVSGRLLVIYLAAPLAWAGYAYVQFAQVVPQSIMAKRHFSAIYRPYIEHSFELSTRLALWPQDMLSLLGERVGPLLMTGSYANTPVSKLQIAALLFALTGLLLLAFEWYARRDRRLAYLAYPLGFLLLYAVIGRTEVWYFASFTSSALLLLTAGAAAAVQRLCARLAPRLSTLAPALVAGALMLTCNQFSFSAAASPARLVPRAGDPRGLVWQANERQRYDTYRAAAEFLNRQDQQGLALISEVGVFGYYYHGPVFDAVGLCSPQALRFYPPPHEEIFDSSGSYRTPANNFTPYAMIAAIQPQYVVNALIYSLNLLEADGPFLREYVELAKLGPAWGDFLYVFQRRAD